MADPKEVPVHTTTAEDAQHILNLLRIVDEVAKTPKLAALGAEAMNELLSLNAKAVDRLAQYAKDVAARDAEIQKARETEAAKLQAAEEARIAAANAPKGKAA